MLYSGHLSIADTFSRTQLSPAIAKPLYIEPLYSGHLSIADTCPRNQLSPVMVKPLYIEPLYSGHLSIADTFLENQWCPLLRGFTVIHNCISVEAKYNETSQIADTIGSRKMCSL